MSIPEAAVTIDGWVIVSSGSTTASVGRSRGWLMPVFTCWASTSRTQIVVLSLPVPVVVGTATSGLSGWRGARPPPTGLLTYSRSSPSLVPSRLVALAVSMADPPPTATYASKGPSARPNATASSSEASVGSTWARSKTTTSMPAARIWSAMRAGWPVAATPGSVTSSTRRASNCPRS